MTKEEASAYLNVQIEAIGDTIHAWTGPEMVDLPEAPLLLLSAANPKGVKVSFSANRLASQQLTTYLVNAGLKAYKNLWPTQHIIVGVGRLEGGCALYLEDKEQIPGLLNTARMFHQAYIYELTKDELRVLDSLTGEILGAQPRSKQTFTPEPVDTAAPAKPEYTPKGFDEL